MDKSLIKFVPILLSVCCLGYVIKNDIEKQKPPVSLQDKKVVEETNTSVPSDVSNGQVSGISIDITTEQVWVIPTEVSIDTSSDSLVNQMEPNKIESVQGIEYMLQYTETKKATGIQVHDRDVYSDNNGTEAEYDHLTGQLVGFSTNVSSGKPDETISEEEVLQIAHEYIGAHCNLSQYSLVNINYSEYTGYAVSYTKIICGYATTDKIVISISADGKIQWFVYNPYVFENIQIDSVNEEEALKKLKSAVKTFYKDTLIQYEVQDKQLAKGENNKVVLQFVVEAVYNYNSMEVTEKRFFDIEI